MSKIVGIDAGGTKSRVIVGEEADLARGSFESHVFGPGNFRYIGSDGIRKLALKIKDHFEIDSPEAARVIGGFAGAGSRGSQAAVSGAFQMEGFQAERITIASDASLTLGAMRNKGVLLIAGTGGVCIGRKYGTDIQSLDGLVRVGGHGYRVDGDASGFYLGRRAVNIALRLADGLHQEPSVLGERVLEEFGLSKVQNLPALLYPPPEQAHLVKAKIASLAPAVMESAAKGDKVASSIVSDAVERMADYVQAVCKKMSVEETSVALHGGLFKSPFSPELLIEPMKTHPYLKDLKLEFFTLGVHAADRDALVEAVQFVLDVERESAEK